MLLSGKCIIIFLICNFHSVFGNNRDWWRSTTIYEIFVWSFKDSNGDGVGDIKGITSMLDYFVDLKIETLWLCPFFVSPMVDFGYDVADYYDVDPRLGTLEDFEELMAEATKRGLKVIVDFVLNHSSDEHPWFLKSVDKIEPYTDFYIWKDAKGRDENGNLIPPNNWLREKGGSAWNWNAKRKQFYYAVFNEHQVDFNLRNPHVRNETMNIIKFWFDKGVYGGRLDATGHYIEDASFRDEDHPEWISGTTVVSPLYFADSYHKYTFNQRESYQYIHDLREFIDSRYNSRFEERILIVECYTSWNYTMMYYGTDTYKIAHFPFNFNLIFTTHFLSPKTLDTSITSWLKRMPQHGVANWQIGNHDYIRMVNNLNPECMDVMMMIVMTLPGVACIYYGQEIGMTDTRIRPDQVRDFTGRDPSRAPMQWDDSLNAGFTSNSKPWLPVNPNYYHVNVAAEKKLTKSRYNLFKTLSILRRTAPLKQGNFTSYLVSEWVYAYVRSTKFPKDSSVIIITNLGSEAEMVNLHTSIPNLPAYVKVIAGSLNAGYFAGGGNLPVQSGTVRQVGPGIYSVFHFMRHYDD